MNWKYLEGKYDCLFYDTISAFEGLSTVISLLQDENGVQNPAPRNMSSLQSADESFGDK